MDASAADMHLGLVYWEKNVYVEELFNDFWFLMQMKLFCSPVAPEGHPYTFKGLNSCDPYSGQ